MNIVQNNTHPIFEADQVLTSAHLNEMFNYLEEQGRLSRAKLIGSGIVCGLDVSLEDAGQGVTSVVISKGAGLSSKGYLIAMKGDGPRETTSYPYFTPYSDPNEQVYPFFDAGNGEIPLLELQTQRIEGAEPLVNLDLPITDYSVMLYLECYDKKLKNCIENDCNEKGVERQFNLRKLLLRKTHLRTIICQEEKLNVPKSETEIDQFANARYYLSNIKLPRFRTNGVDIISPSQFIYFYQKLISVSGEIVFNKIKNQITFLDPILKKEVNVRQELNKFFDNFPSNLDEAAKNIDVCNLQYTYDYLCDVAATYNELVDAAFDLISECCPALDRFPKHLRLGGLTREMDCKPSPYRTGFTQSPIHKHQHEQRAKVLSLFQRLSSILSGLNSVKEFKTIKITPSAALSQSLSKQAIPFYYDIDATLLKNWNADLKRKCREQENLSYHADNYATKDHVINPLKYGLNEYDFFRIEGHICKDYRSALRDVIGIRNKMNLPFDVIALKIGRDARGTEFDKLSCNFRDLEILCDAWKTELECLLGKVIKKVTKPKIQDLIVKDAAVGGGVAVIPTVILDTDLVKPVGVGNLRDLGLNTFAEAKRFDLEEKRINGKLAFTPKIFEEVTSKVELEKETIGAILRTAMQEENDICKYSAAGSRALLKIKEVAALPLEDMLVAYQYPLELSQILLEFAKLVDQDCADINLDALRKSLDELNKRAERYLASLRSYKSRAATSKVNIDYETMFQITSLLQSNCTFKALEGIRKEMDRRKEEIMRMNLFHEYLKKNPGIDHKAGVPKGGTFVMVYAGQDNRVINRGLTAKGSSSIRYTVRGTVTDIKGEALIGATVLVKGTTIGTTTDIDGKYSLTVLGGTQLLEISFIGFDTVEAVVSGATELDIQLLPPDSNQPDSGIVIADFYLPYLCCSDCPPVSFIIPEEKTEEEEEVVALDIAKKTFCSQSNGVSFAFIVSPADGLVTGEGVIGTLANGFRFLPEDVDLGTEVSKEITFQVNGKDVPLKVVVNLSPEAGFEAVIEWRRDVDQKIRPFVDLSILDYDERFKYEWEIKAVFGDRKEVIIEDIHPEKVKERTFVLERMKEGVLLEISLRAANNKCFDSNSLEMEIPKLEVPVDIGFQLLFNEKPLDAPFRFPNTVEDNILIMASPPGKFDGNTSAQILELSDPKLSQDKKSAIFSFTPNKKPVGKYVLKYEIENQTKNLTIEIISNFTPDRFTSVAGLGTLNTNIKVIDAFGANSKSVESTMGIAKALGERMENPATAKNVIAGGFNDAFKKALTPAMDEVAKKVMGTNVNKQKVIFDVYRMQLIMLLEMIAVQKNDLKTKDVLGGMLTRIGRQLKSMKAKGVKVNTGKSTEKLIEVITSKMLGKPKAAKAINNLIKVVQA